MTAVAAKTFRVALAGNPNTGKTTVFNALTGYRARVGNYAGVTVEKKSGPLKGAAADRPVELIDLPGTYSLAARSADEMVAADVLLGARDDVERPDLVLVVLDASNLERNLYLATQVMECGLPCAFLLNMLDVAQTGEVQIDREELQRRFRVPVFPVIASKGEGLDKVRAWLRDWNTPDLPGAVAKFPPEFSEEAAALRARLLEIGVPEVHAAPFHVQRVLLEAEGSAEKRLIREGGDRAAEAIAESRARLKEAGLRLLTLEAKVRYGAISNALEGVVTRPGEHKVSISDRIDGLLIHRVWGTAIFALLMLIVFQAIYSWSAPLMDGIDALFGALGGVVAGALPEGPLQGFLVDGVIAGVGGVVIFLPQILVLFFFISLLEDCGYMARAAFLMDRLLSRAGLSGRSFIPMLSSFACAIPGIMATRTIEDRRDRLTTILIAPLMSCSARLPVYVLLIGAFVPERSILGPIGLQGLTLFAMYLVGLAVAIPVALILKRTLLKGRTPSFIMELPPYRRPDWKTVLYRLFERGGAFLKRAGTVIFAVSVIIWALAYYPRPESVVAEVEDQYASLIAAAETPEQAEAIAAERDRVAEGALLRQSVLGRMGRLVEPVVQPLGWDWRIGMAVIASFPAREVVVATMGIVYDVGADTDEVNPDLREELQNAVHPDGSKVFTLPVALSIMVFFALCAQCAATLAVIQRETNSWRWPLFAFGYMTALAWLAALLVYQIGTALQDEVIMSESLQHTIILVAIAAAAAFLLRRGWRMMAVKKQDSCGCGTDSCAAKAEMERRMKRSRGAARPSDPPRHT